MGNILMALNEIRRNKPLTHKYVVTKRQIKKSATSCRAKDNQILRFIFLECRPYTALGNHHAGDIENQKIPSLRRLANPLMPASYQTLSG